MFCVTSFIILWVFHYFITFKMHILNKLITSLILVQIGTINCEIRMVSLKQSYENFPFINHSAQLSIACNVFYSNPNDFQKLALSEASGTIPSGILHNNSFSLGNFHECLQIKNYSDSGQWYQGKYCLGSFKLFNKTNLQIAECMPDFCTKNDFSKRFSGAEFRGNSCKSESSHFKLNFQDHGAVFTLALIGVITIIVILSTFYDTLQCYCNKQIYHPLMVAFSIRTNLKTISAKSHDPKQLHCLSGIRTLSIMWIMLTHSYYNMVYGPITNDQDRKNFFLEAQNFYVIQGNLGVESFLSVGGLVFVYTHFNSFDKGLKYNIITSVLQRYLRLAPSLLIVILLYLNILKYLGDGPFWDEILELEESCKESWIFTLLLIHNIFSADTMCVMHSWYVSLDMQLFICASLILIVFRKFPKKTTYFLYFLIVLGVLSPITISYLHRLPYAGSSMNAHQESIYKQYYYFQAYSRFGPYVLGMLTGYQLYLLKSNKTKFEPSKRLITILWILTLSSFLIMYGDANKFNTKLSGNDFIYSALFNGTYRNVFAFGVCLLSYLCIANYGGIINIFLSCGFFRTMGQLTYSFYLIHYPVTIIRMAALKVPFTFSPFNVMFNYCGDFMITLVLSLVLSLMAELPFMVVAKYITILIPNPFKIFKI